MSLDLGVNKSPQNVGRDREVDEDELCLLVEAEQGEVVTQLHGLNGVLLLLTQRQKRNSRYHHLLNDESFKKQKRLSSANSRLLFDQFPLKKPKGRSSRRQIPPSSVMMM